MSKVFLFFILISFALCGDIKTTCEDDSTGNCIKDAKEASLPLQYNDLFMNQPKYNKSDKMFNSTDYFDFEVGEKIFDLLDEFRILPFPKRRFIGRSQGNFLHFMHLAYTKKLPIYFTIDQMIYPYIENTNYFNMDYIEDNLRYLLKQFLTNIVKYGIKEKVDKDLIKYFAIGLSMIDDDYNVYEKEKFLSIKNEILTIKENSTFMLNMTLFNRTKTINKYSFVPVTSMWKLSDELRSVSNCFRWFQSILFSFDDEIDTIASIGEIIFKSSEANTYKHLKSISKFLFNEEEPTLNPLEVYENIDSIKKNKTKITKEGLLSFSMNFTFNNKEAEELFKKDRESKTSLFSYYFALENWVNYQMLSPPKGRLFPSLFEFVDIAHRGTLMRNLTYDRYMGKNNTRLYRYRDGINMSKEYNDTIEIVYDSYKKETEKWESTYENGFHYLLWLAGDKDTNKNEKSDNAYKTKMFNSLMGAYIHFKHDIPLIEQLANVKPSLNEYSGEIIDVMFESDIPFYEELKKQCLSYKKILNDSITYTLTTYAPSNKTSFTSLTTELSELIDPMLTAIDKIIRGIKTQYGYMDTILSEKELKEIFYYDKSSKSYKGWYADLFKGRTEQKLFEFDIYASNFYSGRPIEKVKFQGAVVYAAMNYLEMGIVVKEDKRTMTNKVMTYAGYSGNEYPHGWSDNINLEGLRKMIINRK